MTRDEFVDKYGHVQVTFTDFFKHTFNYRADLDDGSVLIAHYGGSVESLWGHEVGAGVKEALYSLAPYAAEVINSKGEEFEHFYE
jgi:hypothetical protein